MRDDRLYQEDSAEINIMDIVWSVLRHWRSLIAAILVVGAVMPGLTTAAQAGPVYYEKDGFKVAILNFTEILNLGGGDYDAEVLSQHKENADYFEAAARGLDRKVAKQLCNLYMSDVMALMNASGKSIGECAMTPAALAALEILAMTPELPAKVRKNARLLAELLDLPPPDAAIIPVLVGGEEAALAKSAALREKGSRTPAIRYPTVPKGRARLRISLTAAHAPCDLETLARAIRNA